MVQPVDIATARTALLCLIQEMSQSRSGVGLKGDVRCQVRMKRYES